MLKMNLYRNKYRVESIRLKNWDYSNNGFYFITICTKDRFPFFGEIIDDEMFLSDIGKIINNEWYKSEKIRPNIILDEFVIMPNHIHGIIFIYNKDASEKTNVNDFIDITNNYNPSVETHCNASLRETSSQFINNNDNKKNNLSNIIRGFKSSSTKLIHIMGFNDFAWQPRFYEHIIKDEKTLQNIREYIINNPINWSKDKNNIENKKK